jgi:hypothetical protein
MTGHAQSRRHGGSGSQAEHTLDTVLLAKHLQAHNSRLHGRQNAVEISNSSKRENRATFIRRTIGRTQQLRWITTEKDSLFTIYRTDAKIRRTEVMRPFGHAVGFVDARERNRWQTTQHTRRHAADDRAAADDHLGRQEQKM